jgi:hypothetical protein
MLRTIKNLLVGIALVLLAIIIDRGLQDATRHATDSEGETGTSAGSPRNRRKPFPHWRTVMPKKRFELPYWVWLVFFGIGLYLLLAVGKAGAQDLGLIARRNVYITSDWGSGSGFIYRKDTVITAAHLLGPNMKVNGLDAKPVVIDTTHDILLLHTKTEQLPDLRFNLAPTPLLSVVEVGNPLSKRNFFSVGYVAYANHDIVNTSNVVMAGYSGAAGYDPKGNLVGMVVAGEGNCAFGYTITRMVSARRITLFLFARTETDVDTVLSDLVAGRGNGGGEAKCTSKAPARSPP